MPTADAPARETVLSTRGLSRHFRGFRAVDGVDLDVAEGDVHALVGPNGAGKTTLFDLLTGFVAPSSGRIELGGQEVTRLPPERVARRGMARSFQITNLFPQLSVRSHLELACQGTTALGMRFWRSDKLLHRFRQRVDGLLDEVGLADAAGVPAGRLPYGQKRALEIALTLASSPRVLLLDEPTAGMGLDDVNRTVELIRRVRAGRTVVLVEHNMTVVGNLAERVTVLQHGTVLAEGSYAEMRRDARVIAAYLGDPGARS